MFNPNAPGNGSWFTPTGGTAAGTGSEMSSDQWNQYLQQIAAAINQTGTADNQVAGDAINQANTEANQWKRYQLQQQYADAQKGRDNAIQLENLRNQASKYGFDQQRQSTIDQLAQTQRQFEATHALDMQKFGLSVADSYARYASSPDMTWARDDFLGALSRVSQGGQPGPIAAEASQPKAKTWADFAALSGYSANPVVQANQSSNAAAAGGGGQTAAATSASQGATGGGTDQRVTAANAVMKAIPPSGDAGHDDQDWAALNAIKSLYFAGQPGSVARLGAARQKIAQAGLARLGYDPSLVQEDYQRAGVGQGAAGMAA